MLPEKFEAILAKFYTPKNKLFHALKTINYVYERRKMSGQTFNCRRLTSLASFAKLTSSSAISNSV